MRLKTFIIFIFVIATLGMFATKIVIHNGVVIYIYNETNTNTKDLNIKFFDDNEFRVHSVEANGKIVMKAEPTDDFREGSLDLIYYDDKQNEHKETLIGYIQRGQSGKVRVHIKSVGSDGVIEMNVDKIQIPF